MVGIPRGAVRACVLIENIFAAFEMEVGGGGGEGGVKYQEILWELREHSAGLNCGM